MTEYERGFNDGFAAALARPDRAASHTNGVVPDRTLTGTKVVPVRVHQRQLTFLTEYAAALGCSMAAAVRNVIDKNIPR